MCTQVQVRHTSPDPSPAGEPEEGPPEITSFQRRLVITHDDHGTIHSALKLIHHVENDLALIYHKIYETCTFSNEIYANAALAAVCVFKSFDREEKVQRSWRRPRPDSEALPWRRGLLGSPGSSKAQANHPEPSPVPSQTQHALYPPISGPPSLFGSFAAQVRIFTGGKLSLSPNQGPSGCSDATDN